MDNRKQIEILNVEHLLDAKYVIPLYQRNFAWGEEQISRLLRDIYESMKSKKEEQYFVGSLVVIQRKGGEYEVIDGQQRLTILALLSIVLHLDVKPNIDYDSRPEVERFFEQISTGLPISQGDSSISHYLNAKEIIQEEIKRLEYESDSNSFIEDICSFIRERVCVVRDVMPQDTDVASYFEIMNNRGEQLQEHEIIKGLLLDKLQNNPQLSQLCSMIWDACSQMDERIQRSFPKPIRIALFGKDYNDLIPYNHFKTLFENINLDHSITKGVCLEKILEPDFQYMPSAISADSSEEKPEKYNEESIIDFPNFLMHVFKLYYETNCCNQETDAIPLHDKHLLKTYRLIRFDLDPVEFIYQLLRCRTIFDRYLVKTNYVNDDNEENREWSLRYPKKYTYHERTQLRFDNTFNNDHQDTIVKALSCIQVSHPSRYYKYYLQTILSWFKRRDSIIMDGEEYLHKLNTFIYEELIDKCSCYFGLKEYDEKFQGTKVSHVTLYYIDYLLWQMHTRDIEQKGEEREWYLLKKLKDFRFQYWNSVEHHYPQKRKDEFKKENVSDYYLNCLGNLFLIGKSANSRLSDKNPKDKAKLYDGNDVNIAPNRQLIYAITRESDWNLSAIKHHFSFIEKIYENANIILNIRQP